MVKVSNLNIKQYITPKIKHQMFSYLEWVLVGEEVDDFEAVLDDGDGLQFLTVVPSVHHHAVDQALDNRAGGLPESLDLLSWVGGV